MSELRETFWRVVIFGMLGTIIGDVLGFMVWGK